MPDGCDPDRVYAHTRRFAEERFARPSRAVRICTGTLDHRIRPGLHADVVDDEHAVAVRRDAAAALGLLSETSLDDLSARRLRRALHGVLSATVASLLTDRRGEPPWLRLCNDGAVELATRLAWPEYVAATVPEALRPDVDVPDLSAFDAHGACVLALLGQADPGASRPLATSIHAWVGSGGGAVALADLAAVRAAEVVGRRDATVAARLQGEVREAFEQLGSLVHASRRRLTAEDGARIGHDLRVGLGLVELMAPRAGGTSPALG